MSKDAAREPKGSRAALVFISFPIDCLRNLRILLRIMRSNLLNAFFPEIRQKILAATLLHPERDWFLSDLARHLQVTPSTLQRELTRLVEAGILRRRADGNRVYFRADPECPIFQELRGIMFKTAGLADILREALQPFEPFIDLAFVYGSVARAEETSASDIDLMIIGRAELAELAEALREAEERLGRPINPMLYNKAEFMEKARQGHHFISNVIAKEKIFIIGSEDDLAAITGGK